MKWNIKKDHHQLYFFGNIIEKSDLILEEISGCLAGADKSLCSPVRWVPWRKTKKHLGLPYCLFGSKVPIPARCWGCSVAGRAILVRTSSSCLVWGRKEKAVQAQREDLWLLLAVCWPVGLVMLEEKQLKSRRQAKSLRRNYSYVNRQISLSLVGGGQKHFVRFKHSLSLRTQVETSKSRMIYKSEMRVRRRAGRACEENKILAHVPAHQLSAFLIHTCPFAAHCWLRWE